MSDTWKTLEVTGSTRLSELADLAAASDDWWKAEAQPKSALILSTRVLVALENSGITTVEQLKAAGPIRLRALDGLGKGAFQEIVDLLRELDRSCAPGA